MTASMPPVPPRPVRSQKEPSSMMAPMHLPTVPPRPARMRQRSMSPHRDTFALSPLSQTFSAPSNPSQPSVLYGHGENTSSSSLPQRPPSVTLPSIGQEGSEYESILDEQAESRESPAATGTNPADPRETRNVGDDIKLHAPKPALPTSSAKARIATVTRTDSQQAAAAGIGKAHGDDSEPHARPLKARASFASQNSSASTERPASTQPSENEHGIPEIGQRVPMYPNAGDVQAPSPSPFAQQAPSGIGFYNDGQHRPGRHHSRTRSGKEQLLPPGSYGLHGHGTPVQDRFEKAWYEKHPEALEREEHGEYGPGIGGGRGEWALSSDDLNKIVRETASRGAGLGTSPAVASTPNEQIGYMASEEYASRIASARSPSASYHKPSHSNTSEPHLASPLRKTSFPVELDAKAPFADLSESLRMTRVQSENALESEAEEDDVIHVDPPARSVSKVGGAGYDPPTENLGPHGGNTEEEGGWLDEQGYGTPILASDEVAKEKGSEFLQPAVEPHQERRGSDYYAGFDSEHTPSYMSGHIRPGSRGSSAAGSRPTSRPASTSGVFPGLTRFTSLDERDEVSTPLEDVEEYEPLFPEDEQDATKGSGKKTAVNRLKRPDLAKHKFPSQDIWEDVPRSAQLQATVSTPDLPQQAGPTERSLNDTQEASNAELLQRQDDGDESENGSFLSQEQQARNRAYFAPHLRDETGSRSGMRQRFPSRDIWEDTPASLQLQTTVATPQAEDAKAPPKLPDRPLDVKAKQSHQTPIGKEVDNGEVATATDAPLRQESHEAANLSDWIEAKDPKETKSHPSLPPRPQRAKPAPSAPEKVDDGRIEPRPSPVAERKGPGLPDRPKPQVPARPAKLASRNSTENVPLTKSTSGASATSNASNEERDVSDAAAVPPAPKPKPAVPLRPSGGKLASLKAGFLSDLDKRLQVGPKAPKPVEKEAETDDMAGAGEPTPLADARKGRARGPARRKPAVSPSDISEEPSNLGSQVKYGIVSAQVVWQISSDGMVSLEPPAKAARATSGQSSKAAHDPTPTLATNTAGESVHQGKIGMSAKETPDAAGLPQEAAGKAPLHDDAIKGTGKDGGTAAKDDTVPASERLASSKLTEPTQEAENKNDSEAAPIASVKMAAKSDEKSLGSGLPGSFPSETTTKQTDFC